MDRLRLLPLLAAVLASGATAAPPEDVRAVLSSDSSFYREALAGLEEALGRPVTATILPRRPEVTGRTRVVVAFGARAAQAPFPRHAVLVACLAPGAPLDREGPRAAVRVRMLPEAAVVLERMRRLQPSLKRLAAFWVSPPVREELDELAAVAARVGIAVEVRRLAAGDALPDGLRALAEKPDALWLPPDPLLVTPAGFAVLKDYSWSNAVPLYVPTLGLTERGAAVAIASEFREIGRAAAAAVRRALAGDPLPEIVHPERAEVRVNRQAAARSGLSLPEGPLDFAERAP